VGPVYLRHRKQSLLNPKRHRAKKRLGQNFLYDPAIARKIVDATGVGPGDTVVELGPGHGILTRELVTRGVRLIALEVDEALVRQLREEFEGIAAGEANSLTRAEILNEDFTKTPLSGLLAARNLDRCTLVGNIPYYLTRDVLFSFLVYENPVIDAAYIMLQKEVGERIVSPPGSRVYGITSVVLQSLYDVRVVMKVAPGSFAPRPKVASVVLEFKPLVQPLLTPLELVPFLTLVKNLFQQRRKTISSTLRAFYSLREPELAGIESETGIDLGSRPEDLSKEQLLSICRFLAGIANGSSENR
jgi:16S rRNA (adenine1518-N6/adenine1519-N6)-dimethyltransferase